MNTIPSSANDRHELVQDELDVLAALVPLAGARIVEAGCGAARLARDLLQRFTDAQVTGLEVDDRQHAKNLAAPADRLTFIRAGAQAIPFADAHFDGALMLKSLHHVPRPLMDQALVEMARVLRPGGWLYVSEPVYDGPLNEIVRLFNDEGTVRAEAQRALDRAIASGRWTQAAERRFDMPVRFRDFSDFEQRMMRPTFADHHIDDSMLARVAERYAPHQGADGAAFERPMHVRLLRRADAATR
ncbi:class I SAM-dependent methyltransferase [Ramlibacter sp.]|uniref:class I SAM-dependent methyltransferase n=1 Tax=Ramlibacter sp. TaxID=1917967 RepID=UPI0035AE2CC2